MICICRPGNVKKNLPVTHIERPFPAGRYLVSKTDVKGIITYANDTFVEASGFERSELIGKNHNVVRHPDMPAAAFADMWKTLKEGMPWQGVVKNRCKNGDFYWVKAFVAPIHQGGEVTGYISVRTTPTKAEVEAADSLYLRANARSATINSSPPFWKRTTIKTKLIGLMFTMSLLVAGVSAVGVMGIRSGNTSLEVTYHHGLEPIDMIGEVTRLMNENRSQVMLSLQHSASNAFSSMHEHPVTMHTDRIVQNRDQITSLVKELLARDLSPELKTLLANYIKARDVFVNDGLKPAREAILADDYDEANRILLTKINPAYDKVEKAANAFREAVKRSAKDDFAASQLRYEQVTNLAMGSVAASLIFVLLAGFWVVRSVSKPVEQAIAAFARIAQGDLTGEVDISGRDEIGRLRAHLATMQAHLKAMLDEIKATAQQIDNESSQINRHVQSVYNHSEIQRDSSTSVAAATEEFSQSVHEVAGSARNAAQIALASRQKVFAARESMNASVTATNQVVQSVRESSLAISHLEKVISKIGTVTLTIREIAEQTNLLALNAAIEAARAGDEGRGFAVVADEVRKLAERTAKSTSEITGMVSEIHRVTETSVSAINHVVGEVETNAAQIGERIGELEQIRSASDEINGMSAHIAEAAQEQAAASEQVAQNMEQIANLIEENMAFVQQAVESASSITSRASSLKDLCNEFKV